MWGNAFIKKIKRTSNLLEIIPKPQGSTSWRKHKLDSRLLGETSVTSDMQMIASWLRAGGKEDDRGWDGWMASPIQWTWVWVDSGSWWWTGRPGMLQFMGSQSRTRLSNWTEWTTKCVHFTACTYDFLLWTCVLSFEDTSWIFCTYPKWQYQYY